MKIFKSNPIPEILSNRDFQVLSSRRLLDEIAIRDFLIKKKYNEAKKIHGWNIPDNFYYNLSNEFNLKHDTLKKIIYKKT